jgi:hypothetical protein
VVQRLGSALKTTEAALRPHKMSLSTALPLTFWNPFLVLTSKACGDSDQRERLRRREA